MTLIDLDATIHNLTEIILNMTDPPLQSAALYAIG